MGTDGTAVGDTATTDPATDDPATTDPAGSEARSYAAVRARFSMPLDEVLTTQRAVRRLLPDPVDDDIVLRCLELALKAPTGSNGQNWEFVVVKDADRKAELGRRYREAWALYGSVGERVAARAERGALPAGLSRLLGNATADAASTRRILAAVAWQVEHFAELPVLVVACLRGGKPPVGPVPPVLASSYYGSIYPSVQNLLLAARAVGLGGSLITLPLWSTIWARSILGLPLSVQPCCIVPLGWPRGRYGPTTRRAVGDVVHLDRFGNRPWVGRRLEDRPPMPEDPR